MQVPQQVPYAFTEAGPNPCGISGKSGQAQAPRLQLSVEFSLRDFRQPDFETLWRIDQQCFAPGISYSRVELAEYLRRPRAFAIVAESPQDGLLDSSLPKREVGAAATSSPSMYFPRREKLVWDRDCCASPKTACAPL